MDINKRFFEYKKNRVFPKFINKDLNDFPNKSELNVVIIVPFRDSENGKGFRTNQLNQFVDYYQNFKNENSELRILIIEQSNDNRGFNRGALLNIGFELSCLSDIEPDIFIFHDVDLISDIKLKPLYYTKPEKPIHIANLWKEKYLQYSFLGGIISFNKEDYIKINGFPNTRFLWGGEDDIMLNRLAVNKIDVIKPVSSEHKDISMIQELEPKTQTNLSKKENEGKKIDVLNDLKNWKINGLNTLKYKVLNFDNFKYENVYRIKVNL